MIGDHCYEGGNKHNFEPRYDEIDSNKNLSLKIDDVVTPNEIRKVFVLKKYIGDICIWCGKTIKKVER